MKEGALPHGLQVSVPAAVGAASAAEVGQEVAVGRGVCARAALHSELRRASESPDEVPHEEEVVGIIR